MVDAVQRATPQPVRLAAAALPTPPSPSTATLAALSRACRPYPVVSGRRSIELKNWALRWYRSISRSDSSDGTGAAVSSTQPEAMKKSMISPNSRPSSPPQAPAPREPPRRGPPRPRPVQPPADRPDHPGVIGDLGGFPGYLRADLHGTVLQPMQGIAGLDPQAHVNDLPKRDVTGEAGPPLSSPEAAARLPSAGSATGPGTDPVRSLELAELTDLDLDHSGGTSSLGYLPLPAS